MVAQPFERLVTHDFAPVTSRERGKLCNFTGAVKDRLSFECWLHVQSARRKVALSWRPIGKHPGWILHRGSTPQKRVSLSRLNCSCTRGHGERPILTLTGNAPTSTREGPVCDF